MENILQYQVVHEESKKKRKRQSKEEKRQANLKRRKDLNCQYNELGNLVHPNNLNLSQIDILKKGN
jgi:hypothetical protein